MSQESPPKQEERRAKRWPQLKLFLKSFKPFVWPGGVAVFLLSPLLLPWFLEATVWELRSVKISGALFQLAGVTAVAFGLSRAREAFGERGLWRGIRLVYARFRRLFQLPGEHRASGSTAFPPATVSAGATQTAPRKGDTVEDRVAALEMALEQVKVDIAKLRKDLVEAKG